MPWYQKKTKKIELLCDSIPVLPSESSLKYLELNNWNNYAKARYFALAKQTNNALNMLKITLENSSGYIKLILHDPGWDSYRKSKKWKSLIEKYLKNYMSDYSK